MRVVWASSMPEEEARKLMLSHPTAEFHHSGLGIKMAGLADATTLAAQQIGALTTALRKWDHA